MRSRPALLHVVTSHPDATMADAVIVELLLDIRALLTSIRAALRGTRA